MIKLKTLKAAKKLRKGGLLAHQTSTLAGVAAAAHSSLGLKKVQWFKQRHAPFLLLADSVSTALQQAIYLSPHLRKLAKQSWSGAVTLVFPAKQVLPSACYQRGYIAVRVDGDKETRRLAKLSGGLLLSSSLNRKGQAVQQPNMRLRYRWQRHLSGVLQPTQMATGKASKIFKVSGSKVYPLR